MGRFEEADWFDRSRICVPEGETIHRLPARQPGRPFQQTTSRRQGDSLLGLIARQSHDFLIAQGGDDLADEPALPRPGRANHQGRGDPVLGMCTDLTKRPDLVGPPDETPRHPMESTRRPRELGASRQLMRFQEHCDVPIKPWLDPGVDVAVSLHGEWQVTAQLWPTRPSFIYKASFRCGGKGFEPLASSVREKNRLIPWPAETGAHQGERVLNISHHFPLFLNLSRPKRGPRMRTVSSPAAMRETMLAPPRRGELNARGDLTRFSNPDRSWPRWSGDGRRVL